MTESTPHSDAPLPEGWAEGLARTELFHCFPLEDLAALPVHVRRLAAGDLLFEAGDPATAMYYLAEGDLETRIGPMGESHRLMLHRQGTTLGELGFFLETERPYFGKALEDATVVVIDNVDTLIEAHGENGAHVVMVLEERMRSEQIAYALRQLLGEEGSEAHHGLSEEMHWRTIEAGKMLRRSGEAVDGLCVVLTGALEIVERSSTQGEHVVGLVEHGQELGAVEVLSERASIGSVRAAHDTQYLWVGCEALRRHVQERPSVISHLMRSVAERLAEAEGRWRREKKHIALLPAGDVDEMGSFVTDFIAALERMEREAGEPADVALISHERIAEAMSDRGLASVLSASHQERFTNLWLLAEEHWHRALVYVADDNEAWARRCLHQADEVLFVAQPEGPSDGALGEVEAALRQELVTTARVDPRHNKTRLVLLHPPDLPQPSGTKAWLARRPWLRLHHHVREGNPQDLDRLARFATGRAIGLVLSGGGARGFAHVGVVEAFQDAGQPFDCLAGVSMGAVVASMIGQEWDADKTMRQAQYLADEFLDRTLPLVSLSSARNFEKALRKVYGEVALDDLWLPAFFMSANLTEAGETYLRSGVLREAVRASNAPAGLAPPVVTTDGAMLADGFIINNLPVQLIRQLFGCGEVIAVDVMPSINLPPVQSYGAEGLSGWKVLWRRINPFATPVDMPKIQEILTRALELAGLRHQREAEISADRYLRPPVEQFGTFEYDKGPQIRTIGRRYATTWRPPGAEGDLRTTATEGVAIT
jgi:predicted acylesterase/phospholipase RssA/CRP-like cAMP-binding protein